MPPKLHTIKCRSLREIVIKKTLMPNVKVAKYKSPWYQFLGGSELGPSPNSSSSCSINGPSHSWSESLRFLSNAFCSSIYHASIATNTALMTQKQAYPCIHGTSIYKKQNLFWEERAYVLAILRIKRANWRRRPLANSRQATCVASYSTCIVW
jgi:hypothetical protein